MIFFVRQIRIKSSRNKSYKKKRLGLVGTGWCLYISMPTPCWWLNLGNWKVMRPLLLAFLVKRLALLLLPAVLQPFKLMKRVVEIVSLSSVWRSVSIRPSKEDSFSPSARPKKNRKEVPRPWQIESPSGDAATIAIALEGKKKKSLNDSSLWP